MHNIILNLQYLIFLATFLENKLILNLFLMREKM